MNGSIPIGLCVSRLPSEKVYFAERLEKVFESHRQILQGHVAPHQKSGKEGAIARSYAKSANLKNAIRVRQNLRIGHFRKTLQQERCARREAWDLARNVYKVKIKGQGHDRLSFRSTGVVGTLLEKKPEEREFVVDSGASMHMLSKKFLSSGELDTFRKCRNTTMVIPANGEVRTSEGAQAYVHGLDLFVMVQLLEDTPAVLPLEKLCEKFRACCCPGFFVKLQRKSVFYNVPAGLIEYVSESRKITKRRYLLSSVGRPRRSSPNQIKQKMRTLVTGDRLRDLPEWLEEFTDNLEDTEVPALANTSHDSDSELSTKVASRKHRIKNSPPSSPKLRSLQANHDDKVSLQKATWQKQYYGQKSLVT